MKNVKIVKSSGSTERDQDEGQGQGPASSQAERMKNEEIRHTTSQTKKWLQGSHVPVSLTDVTEELGEEVEAPLQDAEWDHNKVVKTEVQQKSNCYNFQDHWVEEDQTPTSTKQAPRRQQVLRYLNIKFYATSTKTQNAGGEEEDASESRHGGENEDENNKDKSFKKADSTSQPKNITTISHGNCVSCDAKVSKTNTKKK